MPIHGNPYYADRTVLKNGGVIEREDGAPIIAVSADGTAVSIAVTQGTPAAKTTSATLTAAELLTKIITVNQGGGAASAQQLPTVAALEAALTGEVANSAIEFSVINTSTVDAEDASITTNTGWTLVGSMNIPAFSTSSNASLNSSALFRARKTGTGAWTLYRIS